MTQSKIEIQIGMFSFSGEGDSKWLSSELDKILDRAEKLVKLAPQFTAQQSANINSNHAPADFTNENAIAQKTLVTFLKDKNATSNQVEKFLVTSAWLEAKGQNRLSTRDVTSALKNASQSRIGNPSDCLNKNIAKGYCEKDGEQFFVTQEGKDHLGLN